MIIDIHAHYYPSRLIEHFEGLSADTSAVPRELPVGDAPGQLEARFQLMEAAGVAAQVLSASSLFPYFAEANTAVHAARLANDLYADAAEHHPQHLKAFAVFPLPHIDASLSEIARALDELKMAGVTLGPAILGKSCADPQFEPIFQELDRRSAVLFMHPLGNGLCSPLITDQNLGWPLGAPFEDILFTVHLIRRRIPERYPNIKIIVPHLGGLLPLVLGRLDAHAPMFLSDKGEPPSTAARRFWYDTVAHGSTAALRCAHAGVGAERLVYGSDYPYQSGDDYIASVQYIHRAGLPAADVEAILHRNTTRLLGLDTEGRSSLDSPR